MDRFVEFPSPDDTSKQLLPIFIDPEEEASNALANLVVEGNANNTSLKSPADNGMEYWMPDRLCKVCYSCEDPFTMFRRRHHCR
jgi:hypothetical protein